MDPKFFKSFGKDEVNGWQNKLLKLLPLKASFPVDPDDYAQEIESSYRNTLERWNDIANETYFAAIYLPPKELDVVIKSHDI